MLNSKQLLFDNPKDYLIYYDQDISYFKKLLQKTNEQIKNVKKGSSYMEYYNRKDKENIKAINKRENLYREVFPIHNDVEKKKALRKLNSLKRYFQRSINELQERKASIEGDIENIKAEKINKTYRPQLSPIEVEELYRKITEEITNILDSGKMRVGETYEYLARNSLDIFGLELSKDMIRGISNRYIKKHPEYKRTREYYSH